MTVQQLADVLDKRIPCDLSEPWDNDGRMIIPNPDSEITRVLCALDCTSCTIEKAKKLGCNVIVTHHPLIFKPIGAVLPFDSVGKRVIECIKNNIAVLSYHTRLDSMTGGVNDCLADMLGLKDSAAFLPFARVGTVETQTFEEFAETVSQRLGVDSLTLVKSQANCHRVAVISGCGKDEIDAVISAGADTFVTGEVMHNHMIDCKELGLNLICATHYATERVVLPVLADIIKEYANCDVYSFTREEEYGI